MKDLRNLRIIVCLLFFCWAAKAQIEVIPQPSGSFPVGYQSFTVNDSLRPDLLVPEEDRTISVTVWYPAKEKSRESRRYIDDDLVLKMRQESYQHQDSTALRKLGFFKTFSIENADVIEERKFPLILFSHGLGVSKANYTVIAEELVSKGNIVVTIDHPYGGFTITNKGRFLSSRQDTLLYTSEGDKILLKRMNSWAEDLRFVIDQILSENGPLGRKFSSIIDKSKIATMGHSLGGNVALHYPSKDERVKAAVNLDGGTFGNIEAPPRVPTLTIRSQPIYSPEVLKSKGRTVDEWEKMGKEIDSVFANALGGSSESYEIKIRGTGHMSFSDAPFILPNMIKRFGGKTMDFKEASDLALDFIGEFLASEFYNRKVNFEEILSKCKECELKKYKKEK